MYNYPPKSSGSWHPWYSLDSTHLADVSAVRMEQSNDRLEIIWEATIHFAVHFALVNLAMRRYYRNVM